MQISVHRIAKQINPYYHNNGAATSWTNFYNNIYKVHTNNNCGQFGIWVHIRACNGAGCSAFKYCGSGPFGCATSNGCCFGYM